MKTRETSLKMKEKLLPQKNIFRVFSHIKYGQIVLHDQDLTMHFSGNEATKTHAASIYIKNPRTYKNIMLKGSIGAAESYIEGDWETDDLSKLIEIYIMNMSIFEKMGGSIASVINFIRDLIAKWSKNNIQRAKENIIAHYDLGNDFFKLFLDPTLMYSCAIYEPQTINQESASIKKLETICHHLKLDKDDHILEIGTGWGSFAIFAASRYGCKITTTTISDKQYHFVKNEIARLGLSSQIELLNQDYRELSGKFDKIVSIEMIEAVGHQYLDTFFRQCNLLLKPGGLLFIQAIVINDQAYEKAKNEIDFIKKYIFPGGCLPSIYSIIRSISMNTQMQLLTLNDIGEHYVRTLKDWHTQMLDHKKEMIDLGFTEKFIRLWEYYFLYCIAGFRTHHISDIHALWRKR